MSTLSFLPISQLVPSDLQDFLRDGTKGDISPILQLLRKRRHGLEGGGGAARSRPTLRRNGDGSVGYLPV